MNSIYWYGESWVKGAPQYLELDQKYNNLKQKFNKLNSQHEELVSESLKLKTDKDRLEITIDEIKTENHFNNHINNELTRKETNMLISEINDLNKLNKEQTIIQKQLDIKVKLENDKYEESMQKITEKYTQEYAQKIKDIEDEKNNFENENKNLKSIITKLREQTENIYSRNEELEIELLEYRTINRQDMLKRNTENSTQTQTQTQLINTEDKSTQRFPSFINTNKEDDDNISSTQSSPNESERFSVKPFLDNLEETLKYPNNKKLFNTTIDKIEFPVYSEDDGECLIRKNKRRNPYDLEEMNEFDSDDSVYSENSDFEL